MEASEALKLYADLLLLQPILSNPLRERRLRLQLLMR